MSYKKRMNRKMASIQEDWLEWAQIQVKHPTGKEFQSLAGREKKLLTSLQHLGMVTEKSSSITICGNDQWFPW